MKRTLLTSAAIAACAAIAASCASQTEEEVEIAAPPVAPGMSFFVTSTAGPDGANFGGLSGADAMCQSLATSVGAGGREWRAYLSAEGTASALEVNARDRIGTGPWHNANGVQVASSVANLHNASANNLTKATVLTEHGDMLNGRGDEPNMHDVLTGSFADGTLYIEKDVRSATCLNWSSGGDATGVVARVGHHDRQGGGPDPTSWNSSHNSRGCAIATLRATGGDGRFFCFAAD
jgi:hypothetical protein